MSSGARSRYFTSNGGLCSVKLLSDCGRPASTKATFSPASASRLHTHPPEAPEPTTTVSKEFLDRSPTRRLPRSPRTGDANKQAQARQPQGTARDGNCPQGLVCPLGEGAERREDRRSPHRRAGFLVERPRRW